MSDVLLDTDNKSSNEDYSRSVLIASLLSVKLNDFLRIRDYLLRTRKRALWGHSVVAPVRSTMIICAICNT